MSWRNELPDLPPEQMHELVLAQLRDPAEVVAQEKLRREFLGSSEEGPDLHPDTEEEIRIPGSENGKENS